MTNLGIYGVAVIFGEVDQAFRIVMAGRPKTASRSSRLMRRPGATTIGITGTRRRAAAR
jgi:hypothetical protein